MKSLWVSQRDLTGVKYYTDQSLCNVWSVNLCESLSLLWVSLWYLIFLIQLGICTLHVEEEGFISQSCTKFFGVVPFYTVFNFLEFFANVDSLSFTKRFDWCQILHQLIRIYYSNIESLWNSISTLRISVILNLLILPHSSDVQFVKSIQNCKFSLVLFHFKMAFQSPFKIHSYLWFLTSGTNEFTGL